MVSCRKCRIGALLSCFHPWTSGQWPQPLLLRKWMQLSKLGAVKDIHSFTWRKKMHRQKSYMGMHKWRRCYSIWSVMDISESSKLINIVWLHLAKWTLIWIFRELCVICLSCCTRFTFFMPWQQIEVCYFCNSVFSLPLLVAEQCNPAHLWNAISCLSHISSRTGWYQVAFHSVQRQRNKGEF